MWSVEQFQFATGSICNFGWQNRGMLRTLIHDPEDDVQTVFSHVIFCIVAKGSTNVENRYWQLEDADWRGPMLVHLGYCTRCSYHQLEEFAMDSRRIPRHSRRVLSCNRAIVLLDSENSTDSCQNMSIGSTDSSEQSNAIGSHAVIELLISWDRQEVVKTRTAGLWKCVTLTL